MSSRFRLLITGFVLPKCRYDPQEYIHIRSAPRHSAWVRYFARLTGCLACASRIEFADRKLALGDGATFIAFEGGKLLVEAQLIPQQILPRERVELGKCETE